MTELDRAIAFARGDTPEGRNWAHLSPGDRDTAELGIRRLHAAGYRILGPDEVDPVTLEKCAEVADARYEGHSVAFGTMRARNYEHAGSTIATAIRALGRKA